MSPFVKIRIPKEPSAVIFPASAGILFSSAFNPSFDFPAYTPNSLSFKPETSGTFEAIITYFPYIAPLITAGFPSSEPITAVPAASSSGTSGMITLSVTSIAESPSIVTKTVPISVIPLTAASPFFFIST